MGYTLLTSKEAAERCRLSLRHFESLRAGGNGPTETWLGHRLLFRADHLDAWIEAHARKPVPGGEAQL